MNDYFNDQHATFGDRLAAAREAAGLGQPELGRRLGVRPNVVAAWEEDLREPRANRLAMLAGLLGVSIGWLMTGEGDGLRARDIEDPRAAVGEALAELRGARRDAEKALARLRRVEARVQALVLAQ